MPVAGGIGVVGLVAGLGHVCGAHLSPAVTQLGSAAPLWYRPSAALLKPPAATVETAAMSVSYGLRYGASMSDARERAVYEFRYDMEFADLAEAAAVSGAVNRGRARFARYLAPLLVVEAACLVIVFSPLRNSDAGLPAFGIALGILGAASGLTWGYWRMRPVRVLRRSWDEGRWRGQCRDIVAADGVTVIMPDEGRSFFSWDLLADVHETELAFYLLAADGEIKVVLPKRGLPEPAQLAALDKYLRSTVGASRQYGADLRGNRPED